MIDLFVDTVRSETVNYARRIRWIPVSGERSTEAVIRRVADLVGELRRASSDDHLRDADGRSKLLKELAADAPADDVEDSTFVRWVVRRLFAAVRAHVIKMRLQSFAELAFPRGSFPHWTP